MHHLKLSSHCIVGLQHSGHIDIDITHVDVKTFASLLINDWMPGSTALTGTTFSVRSGGMVSKGILPVIIRTAVTKHLHMIQMTTFATLFNQ